MGRDWVLLCWGLRGRFSGLPHSSTCTAGCREMQGVLCREWLTWQHTPLHRRPERRGGEVGGRGGGRRPRVLLRSSVRGLSLKCSRHVLFVLQSLYLSLVWFSHCSPSFFVLYLGEVTSC